MLNVIDGTTPAKRTPIARLLPTAVGLASLGLMAGQAQAQDPTVEERLAALEAKLAEVEPKASGLEGFSFNTYARSGLLLNGDLQSAQGGPYLTLRAPLVALWAASAMSLIPTLKPS